MASNLYPALAPRDGHCIRVLGIARISTDKQDERSLDDQEALYRRWLEDHCDGPFELEMIKSVGSGERLDRPELVEADAKIESEAYDLVIAEDLGRIMRRVQAVAFCEAAVDADTRVITLNDNVDTGRESWQLNAAFSSLHHETHNADTSRRIRRTLRNRFANGGAVQCQIYGYVKAPGESTEENLTKDPAAERVYDHWFTMLEGGATYAEVADWLNSEGVSPGPYCRKKKWDGTMVGRVTHNIVLKGHRFRNRHITKRMNKTGRRRSVKAPESELMVRVCPHLAFLDEERFDRVIALVDERNAWCRRKKVNGKDPRQVPKKRTRFPGQSIYCGTCGRLLVYFAHCSGTYLSCRGSKEHRCWNGVTIEEVFTRDRLCDAIFRAIAELPEFDEDFVVRLREQEIQLAEGANLQKQQAERELTKIESELKNVVDFIRSGVQSSAVAEDLQRLESRQAELQRHLRSLAKARPASVELPTRERLQELALDSVKDLARDSNEFARKLRMLISPINVFPYQLCDGGRVVLRAKFRLELSKLLPSLPAALAEQVCRLIEVDLFEPPQREAFRVRMVELHKTMTIREAAERCGITFTAGQKAIALQRKMDGAGLEDPYVPLSEPPENSTKLRRHLHPRYEFSPMENAGQL